MLYPCKKPDLFMDLYALTMAQGFFKKSPKTQAVFDAFIRKAPQSEAESYIVFAGLYPLLETLQNFRFSLSSLNYLRGLQTFEEDFLLYLQNFRFHASIWSIKEGDIIFPNIPIFKAQGSLIELQLMEGLILNTLNFQSLIATKASRIVWGAGAKNLLEFGLRRAQGIDGAISATRAAVIGGARATSNVLAAQLFDIPVRGTMAHSWVLSFNSELEAFTRYAQLYPDSCVLLIDTFNTLKSGIKNAIPVLKELKATGRKNYGVRIDSGDLTYLSRSVRKILDEADLKEATISVSNDLDEHIISQLMVEKAPIDWWGVGTQLVTGGSFSSLSGVFKLCALKNEESQNWQDKMKFTDNATKMSLPSLKNAFRFYNQEGKIIGDLICLDSEIEQLKQLVQERKAIEAHHPFVMQSSWYLNDYVQAELLLVKAMDLGKILLAQKSVLDIQENTKKSFQSLEPRYYRLLNPHRYKVGITGALLNRKKAEINSYQLNYPN